MLKKTALRLVCFSFGYAAGISTIDWIVVWVSTAIAAVVFFSVGYYIVRMMRGKGNKQ